KFDKSADPATRAIRNLDGLLDKQQGAVRSLKAAAANVRLAASQLPSTNGNLSEVRKTAEALNTAVTGLAAEAGTATKDCGAARCDEGFRRYEREARFNQEVAYLYELQVEKSSLNSEVHRERSTHFMYGMLAAQAGVTIATFSLAVRKKG